MAGQGLVAIRDKQWLVDIALTGWELVQGLKGVAEVPPGTGMLFDLGWQQLIGVTTEGCLINLDIAFLNADLVVTEVVSNVSPGNTFASTLPARFFLEVNAGELEGIAAGDQATLTITQQDWVGSIWGMIMTMLPLIILGSFGIGMVKMAVGVINDTRGTGRPKMLSGGCASCKAVLANPRACESCGKVPGNPTAVRLVGVAPRPPRPGEVLESEEERQERRRRGLRPGTHLELLTPEEEARVHELRAQGLTFAEIARRIGRSQSVVWRTIHRGRPPLRRAITPERLQEVVHLRRLGSTYEEIGWRQGITRAHVHYLLHRAGERIDPREAAADLQARLLAVGDALRPPAALAQLGAAASRLQDIYEDAALLLEIIPRIPYLGPQPYDIGFRALLAEEVLRTGAWCMEQRLRGYWTTEVLVAGRTEERRVEMTAEHKELLGSCGEAARDAARGIIEGRPGYETKSAQILFLVEEMMEEAKE